MKCGLSGMLAPETFHECAANAAKPPHKPEAPAKNSRPSSLALQACRALVEQSSMIAQHHRRSKVNELDGDATICRKWIGIAAMGLEPMTSRL
jgi:hypothetical protein